MVLSSRLQTLRKDRAIHLLDIENLTGSGRPTTADVREVMRAYTRLVAIGRLDQFVVAVNPRSLLAVGLALPGVQLLTRAGPDGADQALVEAAYTARIDLRFERIVIGSGDGYFAELAIWLTAAGRRVTVVSRTGSLSRRLAVAVADRVTLDPGLDLAA
ncbi:NYN domain-containing protein [Rhizohabitans arisaemae]|uniref:NYN domain-containing protein n=1 Tax=Rhizohabitans arisaemae TaxID=2720610 RepID=UPI0024B0FFD3|nr:NYN domain-containing protein [Rhizohabitans arisaemae]